jgi:hypothetical protein
MEFAGNEIVFLLGAGASVDAGLPTSDAMLDSVDEKVGEGGRWEEYRELFYTVKSCLKYADGLHPEAEASAQFNIERLVNALRELESNEQHVLYPFIAAWNMRLSQHAGRNFEHIKKFREEILEELTTSWVNLPEPEPARYYSSFAEFQKELTAPLHVFSLNYDMCFEAGCDAADCTLERGFTPGATDGSGRVWEWQRLEDEFVAEAQIYLYKMHGSLDWYRDGAGQLKFYPNNPKISVDDLELIFGTNYKLSYLDPYLYFAYSFRRRTLEAKLLILIGYSLGDEHINGILQQALKQNPQTLVVFVTFCDTEQEREEHKRIASALEVDPERVILYADGAKSFLAERLSMEFIDGLAKDDGEVPF